MVKTKQELDLELRESITQLQQIASIIEKREKKVPTAEERSHAEELKSKITDLQNKIQNLNMQPKIELKSKSTEFRSLIEDNSKIVFVPTNEKEVRSAMTTIATPGSNLIPETLGSLEEQMLYQFDYLSAYDVFSLGHLNPHYALISTEDELGEYRTEGAEYTTEKNPDYTRVLFNTYITTSKRIMVSNEVINNTPADVEGHVNRVSAARIGKLIGQDSTTGDGSGKIKGILQDITSGVTCAASAFTADTLTDIWNSVDPTYRFNTGSAWEMTPAYLGKVMKFISQDKNITIQFKIENDGTVYLMGKRVFLNPNLPDDKPIIFGDLKACYRLRMEGTEYHKNTESDAAFDSNSTIFRSDLYADGKVVNPLAAKYLKVS